MIGAGARKHVDYRGVYITMESSQVIAVRSHADVVSLDELDRILLTGELNVEIVDDPNEISRQIVAQLLAAETDDELENFGNAVGWRELAGVPMEIHGFHWRPSSFEEGAPVYFVVSATRLDTGEPVTLTTGSMNVLAQLSNLARRNQIPGAVRILFESENPTKAGFRPLWLKRPAATEPGR